MELEIAVLSRQGGRAVNEDACGWWSSDAVSFCVVSDGAGGHRGGEVASKLIVKEMLGWFRERPEGDAKSLEAALRYANEALIREQRSNPDVGDMRATAVVLAIDSARESASWGHLGDSRLYCFRGTEIIVQTRDHSLVQTMVDAGMMQPDSLRHSPERSKLLNAMGDESTFQPRMQSDPFPVLNGDKFLLCTDGLWERVEENEIEGALVDCPTAEEWLRLLEQYVLARANSRQDNYSAMAVWCKEPDETTLDASAVDAQRPVGSRSPRDGA
jgi:serine/threonine protein phosphatase PrpC